MPELDQNLLKLFKDALDASDKDGPESITRTVHGCLDMWKRDAIHLGYLVLVLKRRIWEHFKDHNDAYGLLYNELWQEADNYAKACLSGDDLGAYYIISES